MPPGHAAEPAVPSGCYNKAPQAAWFTHNICLLLTVTENQAGEQGARVVRVRAAFWVAGCHLLAVSSRGRRVERTLWGLTYKGTHPIDGGPTLITYSPPKGPPPSHGG